MTTDQISESPKALWLIDTLYEFVVEVVYNFAKLVDSVIRQSLCWLSGIVGDVEHIEKSLAPDDRVQ